MNMDEFKSELEKEEGFLPGETCNRNGCKGIMEDIRDGSCYCSAVIPPCGYCTSLHTQCSICGEEIEDKA